MRGSGLLGILLRSAPKEWPLQTCAGKAAQTTNYDHWHGFLSLGQGNSRQLKTSRLGAGERSWTFRMASNEALEAYSANDSDDTLSIHFPKDKGEEVICLPRSCLLARESCFRAAARMPESKVLYKGRRSENLHVLKHYLRQVATPCDTQFQTGMKVQDSYARNVAEMP